MISNRILVILFLFVAFGMFVYAAPVEEMVVRGGGGGGGGGTCGTPGMAFSPPVPMLRH